ncbi:hypothetical protein DRJ58_05830 [Candidatus Acetothermia bacterium]|nr:MAG: hypothetical protein DRJ27_02670 [Candidatus Acetothermia bacterium]RLE32070.1 MAG: hypothetical protein DRJ58_05830 [Candidatus Acetothermia bacterium]
MPAEAGCLPARGRGKKRCLTASSPRPRRLPFESAGHAGTIRDPPGERFFPRALFCAFFVRSPEGICAV